MSTVSVLLAASLAFDAIPLLDRTHLVDPAQGLEVVSMDCPGGELVCSFTVNGPDNLTLAALLSDLQATCGDDCAVHLLTLEARPDSGRTARIEVRPGAPDAAPEPRRLGGTVAVALAREVHAGLPDPLGDALSLSCTDDAGCRFTTVQPANADVAIVLQALEEACDARCEVFLIDIEAVDEPPGKRARIELRSPSP